MSKFDLRSVVHSLPFFGNAAKNWGPARRNLGSSLGWPPGHYYSTIPLEDDVSAVHSAIKQADVRQLPGVDLNLPEQSKLLAKLQNFYDDQPFAEFYNDSSNRYYYDNGWFVYADGYFLHALMRHFQPRRIVEVGSGFSSAMMLDTADLFLDRNTEISFIEPFPDERLSQLLSTRVSQIRYRLFRSRLQDVAECPWLDLVENDFLFIDSSHVSKCGSDVNRLFFEILPGIAPGVIIHIHDIFAFFEYPRDWTDAGWYWNESYLLRAFLMFNSDFEILLWPNVALPLNPELEASMPLCFKNTGSSIWMRRRPQ